MKLGPVDGQGVVHQDGPARVQQLPHPGRVGAVEGHKAVLAKAQVAVDLLDVGVHRVADK